MSETSKFRPYVATVIVNISTLSVGLSIGWMSPAARILQSASPGLGDNRPLSDDIINWLGSFLYLGSGVGIFFWGIIAQKYGRKIAGYSIALPMVIGWLVILIGPNHLWLFLGRFIMGISVTGAMTISPLYVNEISEDSYRGTTGSFVVMFFNFGIFLSFLFGSTLSLSASIIFCMAFSFIYLFLFYFLPESPVYLLTIGKKKEAEDSLTWFRSGNYAKVEKEMSILELLLNRDESKSRISFSKLYENKGAIKAMIISLVLFGSHNFCGRPMLIAYTTVILQESNMHLSHNTGTIIVGIIQCLACLLSSFLIDRINRKTLIMIAFVGMSVSLLIIGLFFYLRKYSVSFLLPNETPMIFICVHSIFYFVSASMPFVITCEILKPDIKPIALSISMLWNSITSFVCIKMYIFLVYTVNLHGNFWVFSFFSFITVIYTLLYIPETRGKSLIEILNELNGEPVVNRNHKNDLNENGCEMLRKT